MRKRLARTAAILFATGYLGAIGWFLMKQIAGDPASQPVAYLFTWDMFPGYATEYSRLHAIGITESGNQVRLYPTVGEFRTGATGDFTRLEMLGGRLTGRARQSFHQAIDRARLAHEKAKGELVDRILVVSEMIPLKFHSPHHFDRQPARREWNTLEVGFRNDAGTMDWEQEDHGSR